MSAWLVLLGFQLIGEAVRAGLGIAVPGPVIGMLLLATVLVWRGEAPGGDPAGLDATAHGLIANMGLMFVPAGVGLLAEAPLLGGQWLPIAAAVVGSTVLGVAVTGAAMHGAARRSDRRRARVPADATVADLRSC